MAEHIQLGEFWNGGGYPVAVVAVVEEDIDWSAYIGGAPQGSSTEATTKLVAEGGAKLPEEIARAFFKDIGLPYRR